MNNIELTFQELNPKPVLTVTPDHSFRFYIEDEEYLRISEKGFFVRGEQVSPSDTEARQVYEAFKKWLVWSHLVHQS